jgi:hypothetical protein
MGPNILEKIFGTKKPIIGALHFSPMIGYEGFTDEEEILKIALADLRAFEDGRVDGIIIENNYDLPHKIKVGPETVALMTYLGKELKKATKLPVGVSVLWNDYRAALSIAKVIGAKFIRVPAFVDNICTSFGDIYGDAKDVIAYRKRINAEGIALFTDIQVKHSEMLDIKPITESAKQAIGEGSDCLILTGRWTGDAPNLKRLTDVRSAVGNFPVILGSGATNENVLDLFKYADGAIVSTALKTGNAVAGERNVKPHTERISAQKVKEFMDAVNRTRNN